MKRGRTIDAPGLRSVLWWPAIALIVCLLWASGLVLFEPLANRLPEQWLMNWRHACANLHGILAGWAILMFGWIAARHAAPMLRLKPLRWSGIFFALVWLVLAVSGQFVQYGNDGGMRDGMASLHVWIGIAMPFIGGVHLLHRRLRGVRLASLGETTERP
jgi:hypothetical protein